MEGGGGREGEPGPGTKGGTLARPGVDQGLPEGVNTGGGGGSPGPGTKGGTLARPGVDRGRLPRGGCTKRRNGLFNGISSDISISIHSKGLISRPVDFDL